jgi:hypothetical protein
MALTRRQIATRLFATTGVMALLVYSGSAFLRRSVIENPAAQPDTATFEDFVALSKLALGRLDIDLRVARKIFDVMMEEPHGPMHISAAYAAMQAVSGRVRPAESLRGAERWFVSHLVTTWYLGIYYHEKRPTQRISSEGALMHQAVRERLVVPYIERTGFGAWVDPPATTSAR